MNYGIICHDDIGFVGHSLFNNFRLALYNILQVNEIKEIKNKKDLKNISVLFIVDEHFKPHVKVWKNDSFINMLNKKKIKVVVFNFEKIYNSEFPWNVDHQKKLQQINNLQQFVSDINDAKILNLQIVNKQFLSKDTKLIDAIDFENKKDKILFLGQLNGSQYSKRQYLLKQLISEKIDIEIVITDRKLPYNEYLNKVNKYKYILNPLGTGDFVNLRYYEALKLNCIPLQQYSTEMESFYPELNQNYSIDFTDAKDLKSKLEQKKSFINYEFYLEDYFQQINFLKYL